MDYKYLHTINYPSDLKKLPEEALPQVCDEVRDFIIQQLSKNPGHLGSSLGTVELTVALHYVFDTPNDQLVWDVGHQAYAHKILTGRRERFHTNRQFKGIAPFPTPAESEYDAFIAGHASNSISAALGIAIREEIAAEAAVDRAEPCSSATPVVSSGEKRRVVAIIGDGAMTGGLAFEGLNNTSMLKNNLLIVLNDNNMAIDPIKGGFTQYLVDITTSERYNRWRWWGYRVARKLHILNDDNKGRVLRITNNIKALLTKQGNNIFQGLNIRYFGPADGHDVLELVRIFNEIKDYQGPKVLHIITKKGKGYEPAENDQTTWHAPGEFLIETGERLKVKGERQEQLWQEVFGEQLLELAKEDKRVVGITPAMPSGCSMNIMQKELPERVFDVGIAEGHAVTFSAGLAKAGMRPYCNIYSSFLQRAYDNIIHDVALPKLPVVFCIDRAGIVGNDGATHHGLLDLAYLRPIPNMVIGAPMTADDLREMMRLAQDHNGPIAIRYPRGKADMGDGQLAMGDGQWAIGKGVCLREAMRRESTPQTHEVCRGPRSGDEARGKRMAVLSIGAIGNTVAEAIDSLGGRSACSLEDGRSACSLEDGRSASPVEGIAHYDMRWLKPIDEDILREVIENFDTIVTVEDGVINGGLGSAVAEYVVNRSACSLEDGRLATPVVGRQPRVIRLGVNDQFVEHGSTKELYHLLKLDKEGICESLLQALEQ
ncbi:MAG: 1-deoxy-D-xylulose-5-phosphate synthase [Paludibacteraceae bacterium]|nr:1-deoxy-D-xylulose-5-phosphate synthase [Paludibacteraceae bacterium]